MTLVYISKYDSFEPPFAYAKEDFEAHFRGCINAGELKLNEGETWQARIQREGWILVEGEPS